MSVIMTMRVAGDVQKFQQLAKENAETMRSIMERAIEEGLIAHRFYGSDEGELMVVDEWPDPESFQRFFEGSRSQIEPMMQQVAIGEPKVSFWRKLDTADEYGWN
jgi:hypothetical protein